MKHCYYKTHGGRVLFKYHFHFVGRLAANAIWSAQKLGGSALNAEPNLPKEIYVSPGWTRVPLPAVELGPTIRKA
jgi:hypothetical protein